MNEILVIALLSACAALIALYPRVSRRVWGKPSPASTATVCAWYPNSVLDPSPRSLRALIQSAVDHMGSSEEPSERQYQATLVALRSHADRGASAIIAEYEALPYSDHLARWCRIQLLAEIGEPASLAFLDRFLSRSATSAMTVTSMRTQEAIIGTTAIDAIARISSTGDREALRILEKQRENPSLFVRRAAVRSYSRVVGAAERNTVPLH